jgi:hypothetical protein
VALHGSRQSPNSHASVMRGRLVKGTEPTHVNFSIAAIGATARNLPPLHPGASAGGTGDGARRCTTKEIFMLKTSKFILPYEPGYTGHWEAEKRRKETREWLRQRELEIASPSIVPEPPERDAALASKGS